MIGVNECSHVCNIQSTRSATDRLGNPLPRMGDRGNLPQAENQFHVLIAACAGRQVQPRYIRRAMHSLLNDSLSLESLSRRSTIALHYGLIPSSDLNLISEC